MFIPLNREKYIQNHANEQETFLMVAYYLIIKAYYISFKKYSCFRSRGKNKNYSYFKKGGKKTWTMKSKSLDESDET